MRPHLFPDQRQAPQAPVRRHLLPIQRRTPPAPMRRRRLAIPRLLGALLLLLLGTALAAEPPVETDQFGKPSPLESLAGTTVVDFAASWCEPCWKTLPKLQALAEKHPDLRFVVVDVDDEVSGRDELVQRLGLKMPVVWDSRHRLAERFAPEGMPATFVIDASGKVLYRHVGSDPGDWQRLGEFLDGLGN